MSSLSPRLWPAAVLNGVSVGVGLTVITSLIGAFAGFPAAIAAASGAAATSVGDTVCAPQAKLQHMVPAVLGTMLVAVLVAATHAHPLLLTLLILATVFGATYWMAWGKRGGPQTFVLVLGLVFQMAAYRQGALDAHQVWVHVAWVCLGALAAGLWSLLSIRVLAARYRQLALVDAINALAQLMQAQANWTRQRAPEAPGLLSLIRQQAGLAEVFQTARDLIYSQARPGATPLLIRRQMGALVQTVEWRDLAQARLLDLDEADHSAQAQARRDALADDLDTQAAQLRREAVAWHQGTPAENVPPVSDDDELRVMRSLVSPLGWPLAALKAQLHLSSPVSRYAARVTLAVGCAHALAQLLPWASHPHWLLMTVAVVMRGNLEQTLARRDQRIQGTLLGCLMASALLSLPIPHAALLAMLAVALSLAHGFVMINYRVTAAAGAVLALVQSHLLLPAAHPFLIDVAERMGDTLIGAAMAWVFSYVLPSWERDQLPRLANRLRQAHEHHLRQALRWHERHADSPTRNHARREIYDVLALLTQSLQRMGKEPARMQTQAPALERLLLRSYQLLSITTGLKSLLMLRQAELPANTASTLQQAEADILAQLTGRAVPPSEELHRDPEVLPGDTPGPECGVYRHVPAHEALQWRLRQAREAAERLGHASRAL